MNTSKQVNVMIGLIMLSIILFGGYMGRESMRQDEQREVVTKQQAELGALLFVNNCRTCHGMDGEGHIGPALHSNAFLILGPHNQFGLPPTPQGEADAVQAFLVNTISCGRTGTFMPTWAQQFGGSLSLTQINQIVTMITNDRWDLVEEIGAELDHETGRTAKEVLVPTDQIANLSPTEKNCGQFTSDTAADIRARDPLSAEAAATPTSAAAAASTTATAASAGPSAGTITVDEKEFALTPSASSGSAGNITFRAQNKGQVAHELAVVKSDADPGSLPLGAGVMDEKKVPVIKRTKNIAAGKSEDLQVSLQPGKYVLLCNIPAHYQSGMHAAFTVQ